MAKVQISLWTFFFIFLKSHILTFIGLCINLIWIYLLNEIYIFNRLCKQFLRSQLYASGTSPNNHCSIKYNISPAYHFNKVLEHFENYDWVHGRTNNINWVIKNEVQRQKHHSSLWKLQSVARPWCVEAIPPLPQYKTELIALSH